MGEATRTAHSLTSHTCKERENTSAVRKKSFPPPQQTKIWRRFTSTYKALTRAGQTEPARNLPDLLQGSHQSPPHCCQYLQYLLCPIPRWVFVKHFASKGLSNTPSGPTHSYHHTPIIFFWSELPRVLAVTQQNVRTRLSSFTDVQLLPSLWGGSTARLWDRG